MNLADECRQCTDYEKRIDKLEAENAKLRTALKAWESADIARLGEKLQPARSLTDEALGEKP